MVSLFARLLKLTVAILLLHGSYIIAAIVNVTAYGRVEVASDSASVSTCAVQLLLVDERMQLLLVDERMPGLKLFTVSADPCGYKEDSEVGEPGSTECESLSGSDSASSGKSDSA